MSDSLLPLVARALEVHGGELERYALAWARVLPTVLLVPAFGLRELGAPVRVALGLVLAVGVVPALRPLEAGSPVAFAWALEFAQGLPVAISAAAMLWVASMTGAVVDDLRTAAERPPETLPGSAAGPMSALFGLFAAVAFLETGGPERIMSALFLRDVTLTQGVVARVAMNLVSGISVAISVAAPVVVAAVLIELAVALWARASGAIAVSVGSGPVRAIAVVAVVAWLLQRTFSALIGAIAAAP